MGHACDLLLQPAVGLGAPRVGGGVCGVRGVGIVADAPSEIAMGFCGRVRCGRDLVDLHPAVARPPLAARGRGPAAGVIDGDRVRLINFRNFALPQQDDFDVRYEEREVSLAHLVSVDLFVSYWKIGPVAHTFVSFNFDDGTPPVCISIETRPEIGEGFDPIASMFKQFELIYVVGDERDLVRVRTDHRDEEVFLYRIRATPERCDGCSASTSIASTSWPTTRSGTTC